MVGAMIALALVSLAVKTAAWQIAPAVVKIRGSGNVILPRIDSMSRSASSAILAIVATDSTGYWPEAVSPESMMASVPSSTALATSEASARVGRGLRIIESSICVAVITGLAAAWHLAMICFCTVGTVSGLVSMPRSPRATMMASDASMMASILRTASGFSILAMIGIARPKAELLWMMFLSSITSCALRTKLSATQSTW